jgi:hypothetical protein
LGLPLFGHSLRFAVLGSGSSGNCTYIGDGHSGVLIDCGLSTRQILARMAAVGLEGAPIDAVLITHEHSDFIEFRAVGGFHLAALDGDFPVGIDCLFPVVIKTCVGFGEVERLVMHVAFQAVFAGQFFRQDSGLGVAILASERGAHDEPRPCVLG